jgi:hypothetical protein
MCARTESIVLARSTMLLCKRVQRVLAGRELVPELRDPRRHGLRPPSPRAGWRPPRRSLACAVGIFPSIQTCPYCKAAYDAPQRAKLRIKSSDFVV